MRFVEWDEVLQEKKWKRQKEEMQKEWDCQELVFRDVHRQLARRPEVVVVEEEEEKEDVWTQGRNVQNIGGSVWEVVGRTAPASGGVREEPEKSQWVIG